MTGDLSEGRESTATEESSSAAALSSRLLEEEALREEQQAAIAIALDDDQIPGVGAAAMTLREGLRIGGISMVVVLGLGQFIQWIDQAGFAVIAPDIQKSLHVSDAVIASIGGAFGVLYLGGAIPLSSLADRRSRTRLAAASLAVWSVVIFFTAFVRNAFQLFLARLGSGLGQSYQLPVHSPLLIDTYPIQARGRVFALNNIIQNCGHGLAPLMAGGIAALAGGNDGWRWVFVVTAILTVPIVLATSRLHEPRRGRHEMQAVLGEEVEADEDELPISLSVAFERLNKIKTFHFFLLGMASLGFALFSIPLFLNLILKNRYGLGGFERGLATSAMIVPGLIAVAIVGRHTDALFRRSPPKCLIFIGGLIAAFGIFIAVGILMPSLAPMLIIMAIGSAMAESAFAIVIAPISSIIPYRLRSRGVAMIGLYVFLFGAFFGAVVTGLLADEIGRRGAVAVVVVPAALIGGALIAYGARYVRQDVALVVEELEEERDEHRRLHEQGADSPVVQVRNLDFSYGKVQVLFDVSLDVYRGETLALLGTNGAGKSTLLRVVSGLGVPQRGVVRFKGRTVTYADAELRAKIGIVQLMGGGAVFPPLSVEENLRMAGFVYSRQELHERVDRVAELLPIVRERAKSTAGDLSGGEQQMVALAMTLLHEPEVLIIDELSLGLAPLVVQRLLGVIRELQARGTTMIIVEQSLNVALSIADRAVFMEKGQVKFEGVASDLLERDDLVRAVFLSKGEK
ncbi:MAG TPA: ATP-binding protein [Acidimicrobiia bacterium]|nr:ATP-binding protein [Acidimicrobiia bacterium]